VAQTLRSARYGQRSSPAQCGLSGALLGQKLLDVSAAEREAQIEPDRVPDDLWRELMAGIGGGLHSPTLLHINSARQPFL
jgi:hypothetical protein